MEKTLLYSIIMIYNILKIFIISKMFIIIIDKLKDEIPNIIHLYRLLWVILSLLLIELCESNSLIQYDYIICYNITLLSKN